MEPDTAVPGADGAGPSRRARDVVRGGYDLHVHAAPDVMPRRSDDLTLAARFLERGLAGFVLKSHYVPTAERAQVVRAAVPGADVRGAITLNAAVGGINPAAVEIAARSGASVVWLPTVDSANEHGSQARAPAGAAGPQWAAIQASLRDRGIRAGPVPVLDERGQVTKALRQVIDIVAEHEMVLATGHLSGREVMTVVEAARAQGAERIVVTHPEFISQRLEAGLQRELAARGALLERCFSTPQITGIGWDEVFAHIRAAGPERSLLSSDLGQPSGPPVEDGLALFADRLLAAGFTERQVRVMAVHNSRGVLGVGSVRSEALFLGNSGERTERPGGKLAAGAVPVSTYRLQLTPDFGFEQAAEVAGYLAALGVTHVYLSPVLEAVPGSQHGYDVTDYARIRGELGGEDGFRAMAKRFRAQRLGIVVDIVPNHMAIPDQLPLNRQLWSVLRDGRDSPYATWFDIDWAARDGRMLLPILGAPLRDSLGELRVDPDGGPDGEPVLHYFDHCLPLRPGTARLPLRALLESQNYRLAYWRDAAAELNWRRFFDISTLIGVRMEDPAVFDAAHALITRLVSEGLVDGLRVDHPDGLADPRGYLRRLAAATGGGWVVVEKILEADEELPDDWACAGTTGYDALRLADGLFVDPAGDRPLAAEYARLRRRSGADGALPPFIDVAEEAKREVIDGAMRPDVARLARLITDICANCELADAQSVLTEVLVALPVYRAYVYPGEPPSAETAAVVRGAVGTARRRLPRRLHRLAEEVGAAMLGTHKPVSGAAGRAGECTVRFQQTSGPVQAKGVEDTAFYRWFRLASLNEVGGDPGLFGVPPEEFHAAAARLASDWPATMTTLSTHDTKRQEDVRARLAVLAEMPGEWGQRVAEWHERAVPPRSFGSGGVHDPAVDPDAEYLIWQTLVGAWPISPDRLTGYLTKAIREAKRRTSWTDPDPDYEAAVLGLASRVLDDKALSASIAEFVASIAADAFANSLGAKLVQLTMPGVPDVYQGCELAGLSLVDPDNRRPVDYARRRSLLADLDAGRLDTAAPGPGAGPGAGPDPAPGPAARLDAAKLLVTSRALRLRRDHPDWFARSYEPLAPAGSAAGHAVAFARGGRAVTVATRLPRGLRRRGGWGGTALPLPPAGGAGGWADVLTGAVHRGERVPLADLTRRLPVALLVPEVR